MISTATLCCDVRNTVSGIVTPIGFTGDAIDATALAVAAAGGTLTVPRWYDQTGNGYDQLQATTAAQPRIVNAGVYDGNLVYDGSDDFMSVASLPFGTPYMGLYLNGKIPRQLAIGIAYEASTNYNGNTGAWIIYMDTDILGVGIRGPGANWRRDFNPPSQTVLHQMSFILQTAVADGTTAQQRYWEDSTPYSDIGQVGTPVSPVANFSTQTVYVGMRAGSSFPLPMWEETKAFYDADTTSIQAAIEAIVS